MSQYREHHPGSSLADAVECFWTSRSIPEEGPQRVYPDGCIDILYIRRPGGVTLQWIGTMTQWQDVPGGEASELLGVRFRPGALGTRLPVLVDESADLAAIDHGLAREVLDGLDRSLRPGAIVNVIQRLVERYGVKDPAARALRYLERHRGDVDLGWLAGQANLSERQFRRICEARTGLSPKRLARTLRFRQALDLTLQAAPGELTAVAHTCGFADQAHFAHEMRRFTGRTPSQLAEIYKRAALVVP